MKRLHDRGLGTQETAFQVRLEVVHTHVPQVFLYRPPPFTIVPIHQAEERPPSVADDRQSLGPQSVDRLQGIPKPPHPVLVPTRHAGLGQEDRLLVAGVEIIDELLQPLRAAPDRPLSPARQKLRGREVGVVVDTEHVRLGGVFPEAREVLVRQTVLRQVRVEVVILPYATEEEIVDEPVPLLQKAQALGPLGTTDVAEGRLDVNEDGVLDEVPYRLLGLYDAADQLSYEGHEAAIAGEGGGPATVFAAVRPLGATELGTRVFGARQVSGHLDLRWCNSRTMSAANRTSESSWGS